MKALAIDDPKRHSWAAMTPSADTISAWIATLDDVAEDLGHLPRDRDAVRAKMRGLRREVYLAWVDAVLREAEADKT